MILQEIGQSVELRDVCQTCQGCAEMHTSVCCQLRLTLREWDFQNCQGSADMLHSSVLPKLKCIGRSQEDMFRYEISNLEKFHISGKKRCMSSWGLSPIINASTDSSTNLRGDASTVHCKHYGLGSTQHWSLTWSLGWSLGWSLSTDLSSNLTQAQFFRIMGLDELTSQINNPPKNIGLLRNASTDALGPATAVQYGIGWTQQRQLKKNSTWDQPQQDSSPHPPICGTLPAETQHMWKHFTCETLQIIKCEG